MWFDFILYPWIIENNICTKKWKQVTVVIWFHLVSLNYWKQPCSRILTEKVSCDLISSCIFELLKTTGRLSVKKTMPLWFDFILYLWIIENNCCKSTVWGVTLWFDFILYLWIIENNVECSYMLTGTSCDLISSCIFELLKTTLPYHTLNALTLWFDFILYLWIIENNRRKPNK